MIASQHLWLFAAKEWAEMQPDDAGCPSPGLSTPLHDVQYQPGQQEVLQC